MKKLYFVKTNAYNMIVSDDGEIRRVLVENNEENLSTVEDPESYLRQVEDDSSWEEYEEPIEEFTEAFDNEVLAEIEKEL